MFQREKSTSQRNTPKMRFCKDFRLPENQSIVFRLPFFDVFYTVVSKRHEQHCTNLNFKHSISNNPPLFLDSRAKYWLIFQIVLVLVRPMVFQSHAQCHRYSTQLAHQYTHLLDYTCHFIMQIQSTPRFDYAKWLV